MSIASSTTNASRIRGISVDPSGIANGKALVYNSTSGKIEYQTVSASVDLSPYLTIASAASTYTTQSTFNTSISALQAFDTSLSSLKADKANPTFTGTATFATANATTLQQGGVGVSTLISNALASYLTSATAASTYQTIAGMSSYLTTSSASTTYMPKTGGTFTGNVIINGTNYLSVGGSAQIYGGLFLKTDGTAYYSGSDQWVVQFDTGYGNPAGSGDAIYAGGNIVVASSYGFSAGGGFYTQIDNEQSFGTFDVFRNSTENGINFSVNSAGNIFGTELNATVVKQNGVTLSSILSSYLTTSAATTALALKANLASPTFTGTVAGATANFTTLQQGGVGVVTTSSLTSTLASYLTTASAASTYLTSATAASTYQTISGMSSYLTTSSASSTYLTISTAASTYATITNLALKAPLASPVFGGLVRATSGGNGFQFEDRTTSATYQWYADVGTARLRTNSTDVMTIATATGAVGFSGTVTAATLNATTLQQGGTSLSSILSSYLTTATAATTYLPLAGGTLTGTLNGLNVNLGNTTGASTATPIRVNMGGTYGSNTVGTSGNLKMVLYNSGSDYCGMGVSPSRMEYQAPSGFVHSWYINGSRAFEATAGRMNIGNADASNFYLGGTTLAVRASSGTVTSFILTSPTNSNQLGFYIDDSANYSIGGIGGNGSAETYSIGGGDPSTTYFYGTKYFYQGITYGGVRRVNVTNQRDERTTFNGNTVTGTPDLHRWTQENGTILAKVDYYGNFTSNGSIIAGSYIYTPAVYGEYLSFSSDNDLQISYNSNGGGQFYLQDVDYGSSIGMYNGVVEINATQVNSYGYTYAQGGFGSGYRAVTSATTCSDSDYTVNATTGTFNVTLPTAVGRTGRIYNIKNSGAGTITVVTTSSQTIDGVTSKALGTQYLSITVQSNGANWIVI